MMNSGLFDPSRKFFSLNFKIFCHVSHIAFIQTRIGVLMEHMDQIGEIAVFFRLILTTDSPLLTVLNVVVKVIEKFIFCLRFW